MKYSKNYNNKKNTTVPPLALLPRPRPLPLDAIPLPPPLTLLPRPLLPPLPLLFVNISSGQLTTYLN